MTNEPRIKEDYSPRQTEAAHRVLLDLGQVLASFRDCIVVIGGWVPDLLLPNASEPHVGSIDVDLALNADKLNDGRYAEILKLLLDTRRYNPGPRNFQLVSSVDLQDGEPPVPAHYADSPANEYRRLPRIFLGGDCTLLQRNEQRLEWQTKTYC